MKIAQWLGTAAIILGLSTTSTAQTASDVLPILPPAFNGVIGETTATSKPTTPFTINAPSGAPNILLFMSDDVGFAMSSSFGGPVPTPNFDKLAARGERYNRFHTTGVCSPSRAALLTGRNHHNAATGMLSDMPSGYPGYDGHIPKSTATIPEVLRQNGYSTAMFGKHHNVPPPEHSPGGPYDRWPTGLGFEHFYGFIAGETDQWRPVLFRGTSMIEEEKQDTRLVDERLADDAIRWIHSQKLTSPDKPFFIYLSPGSAHAPHQAPAEFIDRFKGQFSQGWDAMRENTFKRQKAMGIIPRNAVLTPRPDAIPAWNSLNETQRRFAERSMEVAAGMLAFQDFQLGRILNETERMGIADNTLVLTVLGDNGASGEGGLFGVFNQFGTPNGTPSTDDVLKTTVEKLGGPHGTSNYPVGWAWAMNTPFQWVKQYTSMLGGIRNGMIMAWGKNVTKPGSVCSEFGHLVDVAPTLFEAAQVPAPKMVNGVPQKPLDGQSLLPSLRACETNKPRTQYFELQGKAGLYHNGWFASSDNGRHPWTLKATQPALTKWELFNLQDDFSQSRNVAPKHPDVMQNMISLWHSEAKRNNVFPINTDRMNSLMEGSVVEPRKNFVFWGKNVSISAHPEGLGAPATFAGSFTLSAKIKLDKPNASGAILALGSENAGWSLFLERGIPVFVYAKSSLPGDTWRFAAQAPLPAGQSTVSVRFNRAKPYQSASVVISVGDQKVAEGVVDRTWIIPLEIGEMLDAGRDNGVPVTKYLTPNGALEGDIEHAVVNVD